MGWEIELSQGRGGLSEHGVLAERMEFKCRGTDAERRPGAGLLSDPSGGKFLISSVRNGSGRCLMTVFRKVKGQGKLKMLSPGKDIYPMLDTDIGIGDMISLGTTAIGMDESDIETYRLPIDGGYTNQTIREMQVLVPDMEKKYCLSEGTAFGETQTE